MNRVYVLAATGVIGAILLGSLYITQRGDAQDRFAECRQGQVAGGVEQIGGPFTLVDETGQTVTDKDVIDKPALVYFGYAYCPDVCPVDLARNVAATDILSQRDADIRPIFISVDPDRDTADYLNDYTDAFHPELLGLTGSKEQIKQAADAYRVFYQLQKPEGGNPDEYLVNHSTMSYLVLPEAGFVEYFRQSDSPEQVANKVQCFLDAR